ncbi:hypothetical protein [Sphingomonas koreensis]
MYTPFRQPYQTSGMIDSHFAIAARASLLSIHHILYKIAYEILQLSLPKRNVRWVLFIKLGNRCCSRANPALKRRKARA